MNLPDLPQRNKKLEADFGVLLKGHVERNPFKVTTFIETKQTETDSILFSCLEAKQAAHGLLTKGKGVWIRIQGLSGEQDYVWAAGSPSHVAVKFKSGYCLIDIELFILERDSSKRKSLTWERAREISIRTVCMKK